MRKSVKREYELDRAYDFADFKGTRHSSERVGIVKRRARRRLRQQLKPSLNKEQDK